MPDDHELHTVITTAAASLMYAAEVAERIARDTKHEEIQTLIAYLERASDKLDIARSEKLTAHDEAIYPDRVSALAAIVALPRLDSVGFQLRPDASGRCKLRLWFTPQT
ncbi:MAG: hypothetical protein KTR19_01655 [Hyphomicrobiales bacterium]|nr:hypothetical protein [Hyphomicrobiales bacterium]